MSMDEDFLALLELCTYKYENEQTHINIIPLDIQCYKLKENDCEFALDENYLKRCRININTKQCEVMPLEYRQRALLQIGGNAFIEKYNIIPDKLKGDKLSKFQ